MTGSWIKILIFVQFLVMGGFLQTIFCNHLVWIDAGIRCAFTGLDTTSTELTVLEDIFKLRADGTQGASWLSSLCAQKLVHLIHAYSGLAGDVRKSLLDAMSWVPCQCTPSCSAEALVETEFQLESLALYNACRCRVCVASNFCLAFF
jgi:hypothetical protein